MESIENKVEKLYTYDLPYHNFDHVLESLETAMEMVWESFSFGVRVDTQVVYYSLLLHDALFHEDHTKEGFEKKEEYSASTAERVLREYEFEDDFIESVKGCIIGTHFETELKTNEEMIVRASDIYNISGDYREFLDKNITLKVEREFMSGADLEWSEWKKAVKFILESYMSQKLILGEGMELLSFDKAKENLNKFLNENEEDLESREKVLFPE